MTNLRIAVVTSRYPYGGADQVAMMLVGGLEVGHDVFFVTTGETDDTFDEDGHRRIIIGLPRLQMFWHHYWNRSVVRKLKRHLAEIRPDVVHFHSVANRTFSASALLVSTDYPTVWSLHDVWSQCIWHKPHPPHCERMLGGCWACRSMPGLALVNHRLKERVWRRIDVHLVVCSDSMKRYFARSALAGKPMEVIRNGVDLRRFENLDAGTFRGELGIPADARVVLFVGNMTIPVKGHRELLRIARRVVATEEDVWFLFVGEHREPPSGNERIVLTGQVAGDAIADVFAAADVFAFPSHAEYAPLVILEAMAAGLPQVSYAVGGIPEQVDDGRTGLLIEDGDEAGFEAALRELLADADKRSAMGKAARQRAEALFSFEQQISRTESLYERVIAERKASPSECMTR